MSGDARTDVGAATTVVGWRAGTWGLVERGRRRRVGVSVHGIGRVHDVGRSGGPGVGLEVGGEAGKRVVLGLVTDVGDAGCCWRERSELSMEIDVNDHGGTYRCDCPWAVPE